MLIKELGSEGAKYGEIRQGETGQDRENKKGYDGDEKKCEKIVRGAK